MLAFLCSRRFGVTVLATDFLGMALCCTSRETYLVTIVISAAMDAGADSSGRKDQQ